MRPVVAAREAWKTAEGIVHTQSRPAAQTGASTLAAGSCGIERIARTVASEQNCWEVESLSHGAARSLRSALFVQIVKREEYVAEVLAVFPITAGHVFGRDADCGRGIGRWAKEGGGDPLRQGECGAGTSDRGQSRRRVGSNQQAACVPAAGKLQSAPVPSAELFVSVDNQLGRLVPSPAFVRVDRKATLAGVQGESLDPPPGAHERLDQRLQER